MEEEKELYRSIWWVVLLRGILSVLFGVVALVWPGPTLFIMLRILGIYLLLDGVFEIVNGLLGIGKYSFWFWLFTIIKGLLVIALGVIVFNNSAVTLVALVVFVGILALARACVDVIDIFIGGGDWGDKVLFIVSAIINGAFGILLVSYPLISGVSLIWFIGLYALVAGPLLIALSFKMKAIASEDEAKVSNSPKSRK